MKYEIIMPVSRWDQYSKIIQMLKDHGVTHWHVLIGEKEAVGGTDPKDWGDFVTCNRFPIPDRIHPGLWLINSFMQVAKFDSDTWYQVLCDDDWLPLDFEKCLPEDDTELVIVSMKRGDGAVAGLKHPTWPLIAAPESLHYGYCGMEQGIFKGSALTKVIAQGINPMACNEDVLFRAAKMVKTVYRPDVHVWFNYLEPGRWRKDENPGSNLPTP